MDQLNTNNNNQWQLYSNNNQANNSSIPRPSQNIPRSYNNNENQSIGQNPQQNNNNNNNLQQNNYYHLQSNVNNQQQINNSIPPPLNYQQYQNNSIPPPLFNPQYPQQNYPQYPRPFIPPPFNYNNQQQNSNFQPINNYPQANTFTQRNNIYHPQPYFNNNYLNQPNNYGQPFIRQNESNNYNQPHQLRFGSSITFDTVNTSYSDSSGIYSVLPGQRPQARNNINNNNMQQNYNFNRFIPAIPPWFSPPQQVPPNPIQQPRRNPPPPLHLGLNLPFIPLPDRNNSLLNPFGNNFHIDNGINELLEDVQLTEEALNKLENKECSICLEDFAKGDKICYLPCFHFFHSKCIKQWTERSKKCPLCNNEIKFE
jgi:hypothetical protein